MAKKKNRYHQIIEAVFFKYYREGCSEVPFERSDIVYVSSELGVALPKNLGDILYSFRYRTRLPNGIVQKAPEGYEWIIRPAGRGRYKFVLTREARIAPAKMLAETKILDATPPGCHQPICAQRRAGSLGQTTIQPLD